MSFPVPRNERRHLAHLDALDVLDTKASTGFDRVCAIAQEYFRVPMAMVSFVNAERQWFKAKLGMRRSGSKRSAAFCAHTIMDNYPLVVWDAQLDPRFTASPLVRGEPGIRFYAGTPIMLSPGVGLGAVCIADRTPGSLDNAGRIGLQHLAAVAVSELRLIFAARVFGTP